MNGSLCSINVSRGGVPKLPIDACVVRTTGLEGDRQRNTRLHGGPDRAVSLYSMELIEALQFEGHPIRPGSLGENLTLAGVDWTVMRPGAWVGVGDVRLDVTMATNPCAQIAGSFLGGEFTRVSEKLHPGWSRFYARVTKEGTIRVGDRVRVVDPAVIDEATRALAGKLWRYHQLGHQLSKADAILVQCSHDTAVAERGAQLYLEGWAPLLIFSGGLGSITRNLWSEPEADQFARIAADMGVPRDRILIENQSTNTGENVLFTKRLLGERQIDPQTFILVQKPYMERRTYATFMKVWPGKRLIVTSPRATFDEYLERYSNEKLTKADVISIMVGDLQRITLYPGKGFQIHQDVPDDVWAAYEALVGAGYDRHLVDA